MMKTQFKILLTVIALTLGYLHSSALTAGNDTLYLYDSWHQILETGPEKMIINPMFDVVSPYEIYIVTGDERLDNKLMDEHVVISMGDSIWLISSHYLKKDFKGNVKHLNGFVPVFFNDKTAFVTQLGKLSLKDVLIGSAVDFEYASNSVDYYYIDFEKHEVKKVTPEYLSELLGTYHDLQMRYEGMKDYNKHYVIEDYFFKYIDRATEDFMRPSILDVAQ